jgi:hypothetical protein
VPNKFLQKKGIEIRKQIYRVANWTEYNQALVQRGRIDTYVNPDVIFKWYESIRDYDGTGSTNLYTDFAIVTCHEIRMVYKLPLRQAQGFIDSIFEQLALPIKCADYTTLSRRLSELDLKCPRYRKTDKPDDNIFAVAIDSTGLKIFGKDEWHQEKHGVDPRRSWCKLHAAIDEEHYFQAAIITDRFSHDDQNAGKLLDQIKNQIDHFTGDGAYDETPIYDEILAHSPNAQIVIPPRKNAILDEGAALQRNQSILEIEENGRMAWQRENNYGQRNYSELGMQRYKRIVGRSMHSREFSRQEQEGIIGCGVINKMTSLGMPQSYRIA